MAIVKLGPTTSKEKVAGLAVIILTVLACIAGRAYGEYKYSSFMSEIDTTPGSIGSEANKDITIVTTIEEIMEYDTFALQIQELYEPLRDYDHSGGRIDEQYYSQLMLNDGTIIPVRVNWSARKTEYFDENSERYRLSTYPIGTLRLWPADEEIIDQVNSADWITFREGYIDMEGDFYTTLPDQEKLRDTYSTWGAGIGLIVSLILVSIVLVKMEKAEQKISCPKNEIEKWIFGSYAIWAQHFERFDTKQRVDHENTEKSPFYFGGRPMGKENKKLTIIVLKEDWDIKNREELLNTVAYMSQGAGFSPDASQPQKAWQLCRANQLLGMGYIAGWLTRKEMLEFSCKIGRTMQSYFYSWEDLNESYLNGYTQWIENGGFPEAAASQVALRNQIYQNLQRRQDSPYHVSWYLNLMPNKH